MKLVLICWSLVKVVKHYTNLWWQAFQRVEWRKKSRNQGFTRISTKKISLPLWVNFRLFFVIEYVLGFLDHLPWSSLLLVCRAGWVPFCASFIICINFKMNLDHSGCLSLLLLANCMLIAKKKVFDKICTNGPQEVCALPSLSGLPPKTAPSQEPLYNILVSFSIITSMLLIVSTWSYSQGPRKVYYVIVGLMIILISYCKLSSSQS